MEPVHNCFYGQNHAIFKKNCVSFPAGELYGVLALTFHCSVYCLFLFIFQRPGVTRSPKISICDSHSFHFVFISCFFFFNLLRSCVHKVVFPVHGCLHSQQKNLKGNWRQIFPLFLSQYIPLRLKNPKWANKRYIGLIQVTGRDMSHVCKAVKSVMSRPESTNFVLAFQLLPKSTSGIKIRFVPFWYRAPFREYEIRSEK